MKLIKYMPFFERKFKEFKAWYSPDTNFFYKFNSNLLHSEIAEEQLHKSEEEAINSGYYRIYVGHEVDIDSNKTPTGREFYATQDVIDRYSYSKFNGTRWNINDQRGIIYFPNQSFLFASDITDGELKTFR